MMNEEIKALIERETQEYSERIKKNTNFNSNERIAATAAFKRGASIISEAIINQFRWRKVEEELPGDNKKVIIRTNLNDLDIAYLCRDVDGIYFSSDCGSEFTLREIRDWMPIPQ